MILNGFKKIIFQNRYVELETPPFMEKTILNIHFDYLDTSLLEKITIYFIESRDVKVEIETVSVAIVHKYFAIVVCFDASIRIAIHKSCDKRTQRGEKGCLCGRVHR